MKTMKTMKNKTLLNKCSQTFCKKVLKKSRDKVIKETKKTRKVFVDKQKELKKKIDIARNNGNKEELEKLTTEHVLNYSIIEEFDKILKPGNNAFDKIITDTCSKFYCNPRCKDTLVDGTSFYNKLPTDFITDLKKNGATSACVLQKPPEAFY
jgi:hypothetical protein